MLRIEGKTHITKAEIERREAAEKALQTGETFTELPEVAADEIAHAEFLRLKELYDGNNYVDALDTQIINRYCLEVSGLAAQRKMIDDIKGDIDNAADIAQRTKLYELLNRTQIAMAKSKDMLLKLEDRLFLNPATRIKAAPKLPKSQGIDPNEAALIAAGFGDIL